MNKAEFKQYLDVLPEEVNKKQLETIEAHLNKYKTPHTINKYGKTNSIEVVIDFKFKHTEYTFVKSVKRGQK